MTELTVATLNMRGWQDRWTERRQLVVAALLEAAPDVVSLQELYMPLRQGEWLRDQINSRLGRSLYRLIIKRKYHLWHGYFEGIGILSRLPVRAADGLALGYGGRVALRANVILANGRAVDFVATHLHHIAEDREARLEQVQKLVGWLNQQPRELCQVIAGDFNEIPAGVAIVTMKQQYRSALEEYRGAEPLATFPTALVAHNGWSGCLDYIFLSRATGSVLSAGLFANQPAADDDRLYPSDHVGLLAKIDIPDP